MSDHDALGPEGSYYEALKREEEKKRRLQMYSAYPTLMTILFLVLGFGFGLWHPGWLVFLTIPLQYIHFHSWRERLTHPVTITLMYLVLGCIFDLWHPGWLIFFLIPLGASWHDRKH